MNLDQWNALPKSYQAAIRVAAAEAPHWMVARYDTRNSDALRRLLAGGTQLRAFPREAMDACYREAMALEQETVAKSPEYKKIYENWSKARDDMRAWFRVAELSFDNYLAQAARR